MSWDDLDKDLNRQLYKLWNRLTSGSYFPPPVKEVEIRKDSGGMRPLGIHTILDRIAQEVVRTHLERIVEPHFHKDSYGYRSKRSCHQAVHRAVKNASYYDWALDLDIKSFFDTMNHDLIMKSVRHYCKDKWVLMYVERWLKAGVVQKDGSYIDKLTGTPQGGVISPILANLFLHFAFDEWMEKYHHGKPFVRYADDMIVHCKTEKQSQYVLKDIQNRLQVCQLNTHPQKTKIVNSLGKSEKTYPRSLDFLGFSLRPMWFKTAKGFKLMTTAFISTKSKSRVMGKFNKMKIHKRRISIEKLSVELTPIIRGIINYYCKFWWSHTSYLWVQLNKRLTKWARCQTGLSKTNAVKWLREKYRENPRLFPHWELVNP